MNKKDQRSWGMAGERLLCEIADIQQGRYLRPEAMAETKTDAAPTPVWGARGIIGFTSSPSYTQAVPLVTCRGNGCGLVQWTGGPAYISNNAIALIPTTRDPRDTRYLYYCLLAADFREVTTGSAQPQITIGHLSRKWVFWSENVAERAAIAHILGTLDDKIELNRRMSETLEAMARALFKAWFVDFEPVRAKMEGRWRKGQSLPGPPAHLYDLFPDRLVPSELGEIPQGWGVVQLANIADIQGGKQLPSDECRATGRYPVFGANGIMGYTDRATNEGFVIAFGRVGACGSVHWTYGGAWINNNASSVVPKRYSEFILQAMLITDFEGMRMGSAQPFIPNSSLASLRVIRPPDPLLHTFCSLARPVRVHQQANANESRTLAALRDALLPKLISGELRVKDAERFLKERGL